MSEQNARIPKVKSILVSQPQPDNVRNPYHDIAKKYNIKIDFRPFIKVEGVNAKDFRQQKINLAEYTCVIFNSRYAIDNFFRLCADLRIEVPPTTKYFCISENIGVYVQKFIQLRKRKVFYGNGRLTDLIPNITKFKDEKFLLPCTDKMQGDFINELNRLNIHIQEAIMFKTVSSDLSDLKDVNYDMIAFFSPYGVKSLFENFPSFEQKNTRIAAFGQSTQAAVRDANLRLDVEAPTATAPSMPGAIEDYIKKVNR